MTDNSLNSLVSLRQTAAELLASAAADLFPGVLLSSGEGTETLFFYDFVFPFEFKGDLLPVLEERMRLVVKQSPPIRTLDMMPGNAASLMRHQEQYILTDGLKKTRKATVQMIQIGSFVDWCESSFANRWDPSACFKLFQFSVNERNGFRVTRIIGALFLQKEELKAYVKTAPSLHGCGHLALNSKLNVWAPILGEALWCWTPKGQPILESRVEWLKKMLKGQGFEFVTTPTVLLEDRSSLKSVHTEIFLKTGASRLAEISYLAEPADCDIKNGLFETKGSITDRAHIFCPEEELFQHCISSLQFIIEIPKILGFKFQIVLYSNRAGTQKKDLHVLQLLKKALEEVGQDYLIGIDPQLGQTVAVVVRMSDALGRFWDGPFLKVEALKKIKAGYFLLERSSFGSIERFTALLLELKKGDLKLMMELNGGIRL